MSGWGFWDWISYGSLWVAVVLTAAEESKKRWPNTLAVLPPLKGFFAFVPLGLVTLATIVFLGRQFGPQIIRPQSSVRVEGQRLVSVQHIVGQSFENATVAVDNKWFVDCKFNNVTFVWEGGFFQWQNATFKGNLRLVSHNPTVTGTVDVLKGFGFLTTAFAADWKHLPAGQ
jgi:hypothetical protein